jgi:hypothetical protein
VPDGEAFNPRQRESIARAITLAEGSSDLRYSAYVGDLGDSSREQAQRLHAALGPDVAARGVLLAVDPRNRLVEIVTGPEAARWLDQRACALASLAVTTQCALGDVAGGVINGLRTMAEHARHPRVLHTDVR